MPSLRKAINGKCKDCIYDNLAPGNWKVQATLCSSKKCPLWEVRPRTTSAISEAVLSYYGVKPDEFRDCPLVTVRLASVIATSTGTDCISEPSSEGS